jgi:hypothetical protein
MERRNPRVFRCFRTLSIAMGVYTPLAALHQAPAFLSSSPEITHLLEIRPSQTPPLSFFTGHESPITDHASFEATDLTRRASLPTMTAARAPESQRRGANTQ